MADWAADVKRHAPTADDAAIDGIENYLGIALRNRDSSLVSFSDRSEVERVRENFLKKKLGLTNDDAELDAAIADVGRQLQETGSNNRVTVYYLLADRYGKLAEFR